MDYSEIEKDFTNYPVIRRNGDVVKFEANKISNAISKAYISTYGSSILSRDSVRDQIHQLTMLVLFELKANYLTGCSINILNIQDTVELILMRNGESKVAKGFVLFREKWDKEFAKLSDLANANVIDENGNKTLLNTKKLTMIIKSACSHLENVSHKQILASALKNIYDGVSEKELEKSIILASRQMIELEPNYNFVTARLLLNTIAKEVFGKEVSSKEMQNAYKEYFPKYINLAIDNGLLNPALANFNLEKLANALVSKRDLQFKYLGIQTLYDRYFLHINGRRIELAQIFFMRVAMGLALLEKNKDDRAIEFYNILSTFDFMSSTPTLFNSGTLHSQLSSCYLSTISDDLIGIYDGIKDNALLSKFAGGLGNDWTPIRAMGSHIKGTNGKSQGVIPFLKVVNDTCVAVNQGGKRKGAACVYLETWHSDIEEFLDLRKNTGDDRRRCHDINTANWIPDLFMKRVHEQGEWTLFSPSEVTDLHDKYGKDFEAAYVNYEILADEGKIKLYKKLPALQLWRKILTMLFETGHPWITFKDPCNIRSPQKHVGVVHSSNLCTEITLNTNKDEIAVCNLGSVNLVNHIKDGVLDEKKLEKTIKTAMRMLDNVVDINFYPVKKAENSNLKHRPVGLGIMGFQDCLHILNIPYASEKAVEFADKSMELVAYNAYLASSDLAKEKGIYSTYKGSLWDQGILPHESIDLLKKERNGYLDVNNETSLNWTFLKEKIKKDGMRNSNCIAIAPTATISNIIGVTASIEPTYQNIYVKSNLSGEFTVVNEYLIDSLKKHNLWDDVMLADLKYFDGSLNQINRIPKELKDLYATSFEIEPEWLIEAASRRQKWIDQAQSLNIYVSKPSGKKLDQIYKLAWIKGLKTTYYLRTLGATSAEKSTGSGGELNAVNHDGSASTKGQFANTENLPATDAKFCSIDNPECEACQ